MLIDITKDTEQDAVVKLCEGNPGAINVLMSLRETQDDYIFLWIALDKNGINGSNIWILFKDECGEDIDVTADRIREMP